MGEHSVPNPEPVASPDASSRRRIGDTGLLVSPVALGCWPISGMTSLNVDRVSSLRTIRSCADAGINFLDTAFCYGAQGESERLIAEAIGDRRDRFVIATKGGVHWNDGGTRVIDGRPRRLRHECELSLQRLGTDRVDLLYLHAPDPDVPIEESAGELKALLREGKTRAVGVSNLDLTQTEAFACECPIAAVQPPYNLLQRQIEEDLLPWCRRQGASVHVYWPLMKGLLAGKLARDHRFPPGDGRAKYPMFQGEEWQRNQDFLDDLRSIAADCGKTVAQIAVNWVIHQPGVTTALCGAKRPEQIQETAGAMGWTLDEDLSRRLRQALDRRGLPVVRSAV